MAKKKAVAKKATTDKKATIAKKAAGKVVEIRVDLSQVGGSEKQIALLKKALTNNVKTWVGSDLALSPRPTIICNTEGPGGPHPTKPAPPRPRPPHDEGEDDE